jgi:hypothetical protein
MTPIGGVHPLHPPRLSVRCLVQPLAVRGLLGEGLRLDGSQCPEHCHAPRIESVPLRAGLHPRPLQVDNRTRVANKLTA